MTQAAPVIVDTNVIVAGLLTGDASSPVARILDGMVGAEFTFVVSDALLAEYRVVLLRPHLRNLHGLEEAEIDSLLTEIAQHAIVLNPAAEGKAQAPDKGDQLLWDLLATRADLLLVTGDKLLQRAPAMHGRVVAPGDFMPR